jgi:hypothetical protein
MSTILSLSGDFDAVVYNAAEDTGTTIHAQVVDDCHFAVSPV